MPPCCFQLVIYWRWLLNISRQDTLVLRGAPWDLSQRGREVWDILFCPQVSCIEHPNTRRAVSSIYVTQHKACFQGVPTLSTHWAGESLWKKCLTCTLNTVQGECGRPATLPLPFPATCFGSIFQCTISGFSSDVNQLTAHRHRDAERQGIAMGNL